DLADGGRTMVATVFDLFCANYGVDRGFGGENVASDYDADVPFTPAWAEKITGVPRQAIIQVAREFADTAEKTKGRSMVILGAGRTPPGRRSCGRRPVGSPWPSRSTGRARRAR